MHLNCMSSQRPAEHICHGLVRLVAFICASCVDEYQVPGGKPVFPAAHQLHLGPKAVIASRTVEVGRIKGAFTKCYVSEQYLAIEHVEPCYPLVPFPDEHFENLCSQ